jgi:AraC-like DNA-binding protein
MDIGKTGSAYIFNEKGILEKDGVGFHTPGIFARENLFYSTWSDRYVCDERYSVSRDHFDSYAVIWVMEGKMGFLYEGKQIVLGKNEGILLDFRRPHYFRSLSSPMVKWEVMIDGNASGAYYDLITRSWGNTFQVQGEVKVLLEKMIAELSSLVPEDHQLSLLIHAFLICLAEGRMQKLSEPVKKALAYINSHYGEHLQIQDVAAYTGLSRSYFTRLFRSETGQSPYDYILHVRVKYAKACLTGTLKPVAAIARECGFVNTSHFVKTFREMTGQTPMAFRNYFNLNRPEESVELLEMT